MEVRCPHCSQRNRLPVDRIAQAPSCGKCRQLLLDAPLAADPATLAALISQPHLPVLVDFWAPWCAPCRGFAPTFEAAAARFAGQALFAKVDTEAQPTLGQQYNIRAIPTLLTFVGGRESGRVSGALPAGDLDRLIRQVAKAR
jgi:thioredoxin 2